MNLIDRFFKFKNTHYYDIKPKNLHHKSYYHQPFQNVESNIHSDFNKFRKIKCYLLPQQIHSKWLKRHLSLRDLADLT